MTLLTGTPAGERDEEGTFPEGSVNRAVEARLRRYAELAEKRGRQGGNDANGEEARDHDG
ncbi:MAG: hypothetical protein U5L11_05780 [Arhodomonas sp.]|nr:hypothetical protein [Arhodomonas sp.]